MRGSIAEVSDAFRGGNALYYYLLSILDSLFSALIVAPAVVANWRSIWELMNYFVFPENDLWSALVSTGIGLVGHVFFGLVQDSLVKIFHPDKSRLLFYLVSRFYTVCFAFVCVNGWRGPWRILDLYIQPDLLNIAATLAVGIVALAAMRALTNVSAPPFLVVMDSAKGYFEVNTMFRVSSSENKYMYLFDCLFSVIIVGTLVVFVWKGGWALMDLFLFPEDEIWSSWSSLIVGYSAVLIAFLLQKPMRMLCDKIQGALRLIVSDLYTISSFFATINVWRGIWNLLNIYLLPENITLSSWITYWLSWIILLLLGCSNSLLVRGVYLDAEQPNGKCVIFPCYYLRLIFQEDRRRKIFAIQMQKEKNFKQENCCDPPKTVNDSVIENHI